MIRIERLAIDRVKAELLQAVLRATNMQGLRVRFTASDEELSKAAMLAIQSLTMDKFGPNDVAIPSDVTHMGVLDAVS